MCIAGRPRGFTLLEVMIGAVIVVILAMGLAGSMGSAFMADSAAKDRAASLNAGRQVMEELEQLDYGDVLACDGDTILTDRSIAIRISAAESMLDMMLVEVYACRPTGGPALAELAALSVTQLKQLPSAMGSRVRLVTYKTRR